MVLNFLVFWIFISGQICWKPIPFRFALKYDFFFFALCMKLKVLTNSQPFFLFLILKTCQTKFYNYQVWWRNLFMAKLFLYTFLFVSPILCLFMAKIKSSELCFTLAILAQWINRFLKQFYHKLNFSLWFFFCRFFYLIWHNMYSEMYLFLCTNAN